MRRYNPKEIEPKWQKIWQTSQIYKTTEDKTRSKKYVLEYFPYPSGSAMHVGHVRNYTIGDVVSRSMRMQGFNVLHPMGWDAFGLPAENYAIAEGISPQKAVTENIEHFKKQLMQMGFSYDWSREINSTDPEFYRWTQWFFLLLYKRGLAYQKESLQWWCPNDKTVLANEQVENGRCWRCGHLVEKKSLKQWFFKITEYADRLDKDLDEVNWSEAIKHMQRNWIGRSTGAEIDFEIEGSDKKIKVFTTRPDTIFGTTFMVLAPEHPLVPKITPKEKLHEVTKYVQDAERKTEIDRMETEREKTGIFTGAYAVNPANKEKIPVWVADYVLPSYGTGAIMAVPAHDERDNEFATNHNLLVKTVILPDFGDPLPEEEYVEGVVVIPFDPNTGKYLALDEWANGTGLVGGGLNKGETFDECAQRELLEETGVRSVQDWIKLGDAVYSHYYNNLKNINKRSYGEGYLAVVDSTQDTKDKALEEHENFKPAWMDMAEIREGIERLRPSKGAGGVDHWLEMCDRAEEAVESYKKGLFYKQKPYNGEGVLINSVKYSDLKSGEAREAITKEFGRPRENYKIRDWLISRQRYWGAPIPIIHCPKDGIVPVPEDQLPVELPELEHFEPSGDGRGPLANVPEFVNVVCPKCGNNAQRETDTMDGFACSSWYFLRFADPHNDKQAFAKDKAEFWLPVDDYIGGAEHAVMHLLYARFWTKVMNDEGLISFDEPFTSLRNHGMILAPNGQKMSKSKGNTIEPDGLIEQGYGADSIRLMELFIGPWNQAASWSVEGLAGMYRFLQRVWTLVMEFTEIEKKDEGHNSELDVMVTRAVHKAIKKVSEDINDFSFNTALASLMECVNELYKLKSPNNFDIAYGAWLESLENLVQLLAPFSPHIAEELWQALGHEESVHISRWPQWDEKLVADDTFRMAVQVNGKLRGEVEVPVGASQQDAEKLARADDKIASQLTGGHTKKVIYVPDRLINFVV